MSLWCGVVYFVWSVACCVGILWCIYVDAFWEFCGGLCGAVLFHVFYEFGQCVVCHCVCIVSYVFVCAGLCWLGLCK